MPPIIAQLLVGAIQALIQVIQAKLAEEERVVIVIDPDHFRAEDDKAALETVCGKAMLVRRVGTHDQQQDLMAPEAAGSH